MTDKTTPEELITEIKALIGTMPQLGAIPITPNVHKWLGDAYALVHESGLTREEDDLRMAIDELNVSVNSHVAERPANKIKAIMQRVLSMLERKVN